MESVGLIISREQCKKLAKIAKTMYNIWGQERKEYGKYIRRNKIYNEKIWYKSQ